MTEVQQRQYQQMKTRSYALSMESILKRLMGYEALSQDALLDAGYLQIVEEYIVECPYQSIKAGLFYLLATNPSKKKMVMAFLEKYNHVAYISMNDILSFVTSTHIIGDVEVDLKADNGEVFLNDMLKDFITITKS